MLKSEVVKHVYIEDSFNNVENRFKLLDLDKPTNYTNKKDNNFL
jgi:hypothetical protein